MSTCRPAPPIRPICALGQLWPGGGRVCYAHPNAVHNTHCPAARAEAERRAVWAWALGTLTVVVFTIWGVVALLAVLGGWR